MMVAQNHALASIRRSGKYIWTIQNGAFCQRVYAQCMLRRSLIIADGVRRGWGWVGLGLAGAVGCGLWRAGPDLRVLQPLSFAREPTEQHERIYMYEYDSETKNRAA